MFVYPVREGTPLPEVFTQFGKAADDPLQVSPDDIGAHRDEWVEEWSDIMGR
jgi:thiamine transport system substrate-binding protein